MKLYVDDLRQPPDDTWHLARTISEAIRCIVRFKDDIAEISLDHDISHIHTEYGSYPCDETYAVICYMIGEVYRDRVISKKFGVVTTCLSINCPERTGGECRHGRVPTVNLHTANPTGAKNMEALLAMYEIKCTIGPLGSYKE